MKLFLDDTRPFPTGFDLYCRDCETAKIFFKTSPIHFASLDYNLSAACDETGLDLLIWLWENSPAVHVPEHINIHSNHFYGKDEMIRFAKEHFPNTKVTSIPTE